MALCRMREIVPAWLPQQPISELLTSVPTTQPAAENHTGPLQAAWGPAKPGGVLCGHRGRGATASVLVGGNKHLATKTLEHDRSAKEEIGVGLDSMLAGN